MKNIVFVIFILVALTSDAFSQQIRGTVSSDDGPIVGATVLIKGTTVGTTTDMEGNFLIEANDNRSTYVLKVSTVGYETVEREVQADVDSDIVLSSSNVLIEEITVTGYRKSRTSNGQLDNAFSKIPVEQRYQTQAVSKLSLEDLQDQRIQGLDQAAALAPGFTFAESRGNSFVRINVRGLSATYLYNGIRLESNVRSGEGNINFNIVDNVEFINGSSGVGYGNISPGGAVNVNSKQAQISDLGGAIVSYGSWNTLLAGIDKNFALSDKLGLRLNAFYTEGRQARKFTDFRNIGISPSLVYRPSRNDEFRVDAVYTDDLRTPDKGNLVFSQEGGLNEDNLVDMSFTDDFVGFTDDFQDEVTNLLSVTYNRRLSDAWKVELRTGYYDRQRQKRSLNSIRSYVTDRRSGRYTAFRRATIYNEDQNEIWDTKINLTGKDVSLFGWQHNFQFSLDNWDNFNHIAGYDAPDNRNRFSTRDAGPVIDEIDLSNPSFINDVSLLTQEQRDAYLFENVNARDENYKRISGVTVQDQIEFSNRLRATAGVRYSFGTAYGVRVNDLGTPQMNEQRGEALDFSGWTSSLGLFYDPVKEVTLFASYANTFDETSVSPNRVDIDGALIPNEVTDQVELGVRTLLFDKQLTINLTAYHMVNNDVAMRALDADGIELISDAAVSSNNPDGFYFIRANAEYRRGLELFMQGNLTSDWSILGSYAYFNYQLRADETTDLTNLILDSSPAHSGNVWTKYNVNSGFLKGFSVGAGAEFIGDRFLGERAGNYTVPAFTRLNAIIGYRINQFHFTMKFNNLNNVHSFDSFRVLNVNPIQPRNIDIRLNYHF